MSRHGKAKSKISDICAENLSFMAKEEKENKAPATESQGSVNGGTATVPPSRPNRDKYSAMFAEDNPDVDFEDKEARYGRMAEEREGYRRLRDSGRKFSAILDKHRWLGAMLADDETNPLVWLSKNGIDIKAALEDPETLSKVTEAFDGWTQKQADGEAAEQAKDAAIAKSVEALDAVQQEFGLSDEQKNRMFEHFWDEVFLPAFAGEVSRDTWVSLMHAMNYDQDMANAREEAAMQARNEKHTNKLKNFDESQVPPTFGQGSGGRIAPRQTQEDAHSNIADFIRKNG